MQWNVNDIRTRLTDLEALVSHRNPSILCLQETHLSHSLTLRGFEVYRHDHLGGERANGGTAILVRDCVFCFRSSPHHPASCTSPHQLGCIVLYHLQHLASIDVSNCLRRSGTAYLTITYPVHPSGQF
jgi:exonuclease III